MNHSNVMKASCEWPHRSTCGKGGACAQLAAVAEHICPDLHQGAKQSKTREIPINVPVNAMVPPVKQCRGVHHRFLMPLCLLLQKV